MQRYLMIGAGVLLVVALVVFFWPSVPPMDPMARKLANLADLAERTCLSNTSSTHTAGIKSSLELLRGKSATASAGVESQIQEKRGAIETLTAELAAEENNEIRKCMEPWANQMRELVGAAK